ncbi:MAG: VanZ family protein, partial [Candidatus Omnitrophica bacterium]|nr:VanZ family protein [Candidatus Omnitrophota bacterium]
MAANMGNNKFLYWANLWFFVLLVMGIIFYFSSLSSRQLPQLFPKEDIVFHLLAYGLLAYVFCRAVEGSFSHLDLARLAIYSIIFCTAYGVSDEYHQLFVPGRQCSGMDL